ncbi:hypothetical protein GJV85_12560 [Sulfurimonas aquatica]|uniref:Uncharacterized protein n=1 Tax=Sulfurimonas aquatica TaxID=2672570 RepID=A0A975B290_9BACT|nr:hypothetical protein [Sulfurimonas aquatica]QSZ42904.1 hypothetical protein GJV85_12560 [Sulfurimonas aquatica]
MKIVNILNNQEELFLEGKADFIFASFKKSENFFTSKELMINEDKTISPSIISRAINATVPFSATQLLDLSHLCDSTAKEIVIEGMKLGAEYELKGHFLILSQDSLAYDSDENINSLQELNKFKNKTLLFYAGFLLEASRRFHIVLSGAEDMATCLLIADNLREDILMRVKHDNITLTSATFSQDKSQEQTKEILKKLSYTPKVLTLNFSFEDSEIELLKVSQDKMKDTHGAGAALCIAVFNNLNEQEILDAIELTIYTIDI